MCLREPTLAILRHPLSITRFLTSVNPARRIFSGYGMAESWGRHAAKILHVLACADSVRKAETDQRPHRREAISPGNLLALGIVASSVVDRHLVYTVALLEHLRG